MSDQRDRINAMLNLAQHPNTPQAEAESALAMASKLMQKHGLSQSDIASSRPEEDTTVVVERVRVGGLYRVRRQNIFTPSLCCIPVLAIAQKMKTMNVF